VHIEYWQSGGAQKIASDDIEIVRADDGMRFRYLWALAAAHSKLDLADDDPENRVQLDARQMLELASSLPVYMSRTNRYKQIEVDLEPWKNTIVGLS
jgi:hypothetical protein